MEKHIPFLFPMGRLVLSKDAKELCFDSWALAASALFHSAFISIDARYKVYKQNNSAIKRQQVLYAKIHC